MCGINGLITSPTLKDEKLRLQINAMNNSIIHRGPDDQGIFIEEGTTFSIAMGMRRLSIIDLETGKQPIFSQDQQLVIVFNGEIYNYLSLRKQLESRGCSFETHSDTEVILKLYELDGESSFKELDGMFAFSIYDKKRGKVFIARDFFGEKPLYYTKFENSFIWASELKSIIKILDTKPAISMTGLNHFLRLTYIPAPHTIYENIHKLEANNYITYDLDTHTYQMTAIENEFEIEQNGMDFRTAKNATKKLVQESVESRSVSDVPIGTFLSGGVDSSIVSLCLSRMTDQKIDTFSIGFEKKSFDETDKSQLVAKQIQSNHHEFIVGENDLKNNIHDILLNFDEPFADTAALPTYLISKKTSEHVKVALTGDGGDEIFGGYNKYYVGKLNTKYTTSIPKKAHDMLLPGLSSLLMTRDDKRGKRYRIRKMLNAINYEGDHYWDIISLANTENQLKALLRQECIKGDLFKEYKEKLGIPKPTTLTHYRFVDKLLSLEGGMLPKVDRTSMMNSLECRAPFLNKNLWRFANSLPENFLLKNWDKKHILKEAFKGDFPKGFLDKSKQGFETPVGDWLRSGLRKELESYIERDYLEKQGIFNVEYTKNMVQAHVDGKKDNTYTVWTFYCFQKWYNNIYKANIVSFV